MTKCDRCQKPVLFLTWQCAKCDNAVCEKCLGDYDWDPDMGSWAVCKGCIPAKATDHDPR